jgi:hypothetical protein
MAGIESFNFETQAGRKVLFVSNHHVDHGASSAVDLLAPGLFRRSISTKNLDSSDRMR